MRVKDIMDTTPIISKENLQNVLRELEWSTLFYFIGLFIVVAGIVKVGLISKLSDSMISLTKPDAENMFATAIITLWFSAIASTVMENTILIASIIPLVTDMAYSILPSGTDFKSIVQHSTFMPECNAYWGFCKRCYPWPCRKGGISHIIQKISYLWNTSYCRNDCLVNRLCLVKILYHEVLFIKKDRLL